MLKAYVINQLNTVHVKIRSMFDSDILYFIFVVLFGFAFVAAVIENQRL